jgi:hypothetical protein
MCKFWLLKFHLICRSHSHVLAYNAVIILTVNEVELWSRLTYGSDSESADEMWSKTLSSGSDHSYIGLTTYILANSCFHLIHPKVSDCKVHQNIVRTATYYVSRNYKKQWHTRHKWHNPNNNKIFKITLVYSTDVYKTQVFF